MKRLATLGVVVLLVAVSAQGDYKRTGIVWTYNAMAATPLPKTAALDLLIASHGSVRIKDDRTGTATIICPVVPTHQLQDHKMAGFSLVYRDGDESQGGSFVSAALKRVRPSNGNTLVQVIVRVSSNDPEAPDSGDSGWAKVRSLAAFGHMFAFDEYYYYVQITLKKNSARPVGVMGVAIERS